MLDYTIQDPAARAVEVEHILDQTSPEALTPQYIEILSNYIIFAMTKEERKQRNILTDNRLITINKRETSYQGLVEKFENGEDGIYNLVNEDRNQLLTPKIAITPQDIAEMPPLQELREVIDSLKEQTASARGKRKYLLKKQLIETYQDQYVIKDAFRQPIQSPNVVKTFAKSVFTENITINDKGEPESDGKLSFFNPKHLSALLCNYSALKEECYGNFTSDCWFLMEDLDNLVERTLHKDYPLYFDILVLKIDGRTNADIQWYLQMKYGIKHSVEYISALWRNKIPKLLAEQEKRDYLEWYYTEVERGKWKRCSRCGQIKLANNMFFSKNSTSKDGWYSICKKCRNSKKGGD